MERRRMDADGGRAVHRERRTRKLVVVFAVQNVLVTVSLVVSLYVCWDIQTRTPSAAQASPSAAQATPSAEQATPSAAQATPSAAQATPSAAQATPSAAQATPSAEQATPSAEQATPSAAQATPSAAQATPSAEQATPSAEQATPSAAQATPSAAQATPSAAQATPSAEQASNDNVHIRFEPLSGVQNGTVKFGGVYSKHMMGLVGDDQIYVNCTGPYVLYMFLCYKDKDEKEASGLLELRVVGRKDPVSNFTLHASHGVCRGLHSIAYLRYKETLSLQLNCTRGFTIKNMTVGLRYMLGSQCELV